MTTTPKTQGLRIKFVRKLLGMTQEDFADALKTSRGAVGNWELSKGIKPSNLSAIAALATRRGLRDVTADWLMQGTGPVPSRDGDRDDASRRQRSVSTLQPFHGSVRGAMPVIDLTAGAGGGGLAQPVVETVNGVVYSADSIRGEIVLPPFVTGILTNADRGRIHWLDIRGDSMSPTLDHGEFVAVNTADFTLGPGGVFALQELDTAEVIVKRLEYVEGDKSQLQVISDNPKHPDRRESVDTVRIIGRIVGRIGRIG